MTHLDLRIGGMSCHHCVMAVRKELEKLPGVKVNDVKIGSASLDFDEATTRNEHIAAAVKEAGYEVVAG
ncbi:MAG TPA: cation transporter [Bacteroidota bacterium]|nr:cation transporter [Bacteroidota bacterium]